MKMPLFEVWTRKIGDSTATLCSSSSHPSEVFDHLVWRADLEQYETVLVRTPPAGEEEDLGVPATRRIILRGETEGDPRLTVEECK